MELPLLSVRRADALTIRLMDWLKSTDGKQHERAQAPKDKAQKNNCENVKASMSPICPNSDPAWVCCRQNILDPSEHIAPLCDDRDCYSGNDNNLRGECLKEDNRQQMTIAAKTSRVDSNGSIYRSNWQQRGQTQPPNHRIRDASHRKS